MKRAFVRKALQFVVGIGLAVFLLWPKRQQPAGRVVRPGDPGHFDFAAVDLALSHLRGQLHRPDLPVTGFRRPEQVTLDGFGPVTVLRVVAGGVLAAPFPGFNAAINGRLGDGVNVNDVPYEPQFSYVAPSPSGRDRRHIDPTEPGCTAGGGAPCPGL